MRHGYKGAFEIAASVDYLFAFAATTHAVRDHHFDAVHAAFIEDEAVRAAAEEVPGATLDDWRDVQRHLARVHPSRYSALLDGVTSVHLSGVRTLTDQVEALRTVVLVDRLYDRDIPVRASGVSLDRLFSDEMLQGGYRKKYRRALSRIIALAREGDTQAGPGEDPVPVG